jgi:nitrogen regulatory protein PII
MTEKVVQALHAVEGLSGASFTTIHGFERGRRDEADAIRHQEILGAIKKVRFEVMVADELLDTVVRTIRDAARTGRKGDGKIYVVPVEHPLRSERCHPRAGFLDERSRPHDTHPLRRTEVSDVVSDEQARSRADRYSEDGDVLRVCEIARSFPIVRCRTLDLNLNGAEEFLEEGSGLGELGAQVLSDLRHGGLGQHQTKEAKLAENEDRVAGAGAGQQSGDQDVSIDTDG